MNRAKVLPLGMAAAIIIYGIWLIRKPVALTPETTRHQEASLAVYLADNPYVDDPAVLLPLFTGDERSPLRYDQPSEAQQFYLEQRLPEGEQQLPVEKYDAAWAQIKTMPQFSIERGVTLPTENSLAITAADTWEALGPGNIGGRTRGLVIDPNNPSVMYAAGVAGGVWKTTNGGNSWTPLDDLLPNLAISSLVMAPQNANILYAGTGEGVGNGDAVRGNGIYKTTNGGASWTHLSSTTTNSNFYYVNDIVVSHNDVNRIYAATREGIWRSTNGGSSWSRVYNASEPYGCMDLAIRTDKSPDTIFAACGSTFGATIYRSTNGGNTWPGSFSESGMGRTTLAIAPSNEDVVYALAADTGGGTYSGGMRAVYRTTNGGSSWTARVRNTDSDKLNRVLL
ncbi:MAG: hypothetical protein KC419_16770, partial [Anaerolineales bacterium]|nr:hypothetical protein [Anaerolineales bacterium]